MDNTTILVQKRKLDDMTDAEINVSKYRSLERRYNSLIDAVALLETQNSHFRREVEQSRELLASAQQSVEINKSIVLNTVNMANRDKDSYLGEIAELKSKLSRG